MNAVVKHDAIPFVQLEKMAHAVAKSGLFGAKTPEQALSLMMIAQAEGVHPMTAARDFHIIQGRPALKADAMLARFHAAGGKHQWIENTDAKVSGKFSHPQGGETVITWTMERAKQAGLLGRDNWKFYPQQMLRARCISEGVRATFPGVAIGTYTVEEAVDMELTKDTPNRVIEQAIESAATPTTVAPTEFDFAMQSIKEAADTETLKAAFAEGWKKAKLISDVRSMKLLEAAYEEQKTRLRDMEAIS